LTYKICSFILEIINKMKNKSQHIIKNNFYRIAGNNGNSTVVISSIINPQILSLIIGISIIISLLIVILG